MRIQFKCFYINKTSGDKDAYDEQQFEEKEEDEIEKKLTELMKKREEGKTDSSSFEIKYQGTVIPVKNDKIRLLIEKCIEIEKKIDEEHDLNKKINPFLDLFNNFDEIVKSIKKERQEENTQQSDSKFVNKI